MDFAAVRRINPALLAAIAFVFIQIGIGIIFKLAQSEDGTYAFSQSSSIAISEFCKLLLSSAFFYYQCRRRIADLNLHPTRHNDAVRAGASFERSDLESTSGSSKDVHSIDAEESIELEHDPLVSHAKMSSAHLLHGLGPRQYVNMVLHEINSHTFYGMTHLALMYTVVNQLIFLLFRLADPGTISLVRSGVTLITALTLLITTGATITKRQWVAIVFQICGVLVTQYRPDAGSLYPVSTYTLLIFQTTVSACAGVYNQLLLKAEPGSLHVCNMSLYAAGTIINVCVHLLSRLMRAEEPTFFAGYTSWSALMVIISNIFIGLAITAVYKYADALIKCFATAVSTGILLYIAPMIFHVPLNFLVVPGSITVFAATWLYLDSTPETKSDTAPPWRDASVTGNASTILQRLTHKLATFSPHGALRLTGLAASSCMTLTVILGLLTRTTKQQVIKPVTTLESPFKNTMAFIRWNTVLPQRIPSLMAYQPFFRDIHISMPQYTPPYRKTCTAAFDKSCEKGLYNDLSSDDYGANEVVYATVAQTMQHMLDAEEEMRTHKFDGLLFFHFDAWVDTLAFTNEDLNKIWFLNSSEPEFRCMTNITDYRQWASHHPPHNEHEAAMRAVKDIHQYLDPSRRERINLDQWCAGWSEIYFIPRRFFRDFILLSRIFYSYGVFHEIAIPTMVHLIDVVQRSHENEDREVLTHLTDCWGSCCSTGPSAGDVLSHRCGHKLDLANKDLADVFWTKLDHAAKKLGSQAPLSDRMQMSTVADTASMFSPDGIAQILASPGIRDRTHLTYGSSQEWLDESGL